VLGSLVVAKALGHGRMCSQSPIEHLCSSTTSGSSRDKATCATWIRTQRDCRADAVISRSPPAEERPGAPTKRAWQRHPCDGREGVGRLAVLSAAGTFARQDRKLPILPPAVDRDDGAGGLRRARSDGTRAWRRLRWTIIRPYRMTDGRRRAITASRSTSSCSPRRRASLAVTWLRCW